MRKLQMKRGPGPQVEHEAVPPSVRQTLRAPGRPLDSRTRAFMEPRFGHDFSKVRIHDDEKASESAAAVGALAYTVGRNVVFREGQYRPHTERGLGLLAHELTHVVQQEAGAAAPQGSLELGPADDYYEREADAFAEYVVGAKGGEVSTAAAGGSRKASPAPVPGAPTQRRPVISRASAATLRRYKMKFCVTPGMVTDVQSASEFGGLAELFIQRDYCKKMGCDTNDYFDNNRPTEYVGFLLWKNSKIPSYQQLLMIPTALSRPDIMSHKPMRKEYYEVKPDSSSGRSKGRAKLNDIALYLAMYGLPYVKGVAYTPSEKTHLVNLPVDDVMWDCYLRVRREGAGLLLYEICVEAELEELLEKAGELIAKVIAAIILFFASLLMLRGVLKGSPVEGGSIMPRGVIASTQDSDGQTPDATQAPAAPGAVT